MAKECPVCKMRYENEEFCPTHFVPLVNVVADPLPAPATPSDDTSKVATSESLEEGGLLDRISRKLGGAFRRRGASPTQEPPEQNTRQEPRSLDLPPELREKGWSVNGLPVSLHGIDVWPLHRDGGESAAPGQLVVYTSGVLTDVHTYERLMALNHGIARAHIHAFGTVDRGHRVRASYELVTEPGVWQMLLKWFNESPPSEERALSLVPGLRAMLRDWCDTGIVPISLDPSVLQRNAEGHLRLVRFGAVWSASVDGTATVYRPEFAQAGSLLASPWAAPEVKGRLVVAPHSAVFSIAQLLATALFGQPPSLHEVQSGLVPFSSIKSAELARLLMGGLWPHADGRWTLAEMRQALEAGGVDQMPPAPAWSRLMPGAADTAFDLGGESFFRLEDAVAQANQPRHWKEAVQRMDALLLWAAGTAWTGVAEGLRTELITGARTADWVLVRLTRQVRPDLPMTWRGLDLSDTHASSSLSALAQQALTSQTPDFTLLRQLYRADLRGAFTVPG